VARVAVRFAAAAWLTPGAGAGWASPPWLTGRRALERDVGIAGARRAPCGTCGSHHPCPAGFRRCWRWTRPRRSGRTTSTANSRSWRWTLSRWPRPTAKSSCVHTAGASAQVVAPTRPLWLSDQRAAPAGRRENHQTRAACAHACRLACHKGGLTAARLRTCLSAHAGRRCRRPEVHRARHSFQARAGQNDGKHGGRPRGPHRACCAGTRDLALTAACESCTCTEAWAALTTSWR
jgi:hypothetical protein